MSATNETKKTLLNIIARLLKYYLSVQCKSIHLLRPRPGLLFRFILVTRVLNLVLVDRVAS